MLTVIRTLTVAHFGSQLMGSVLPLQLSDQIVTSSGLRSNSVTDFGDKDQKGQPDDLI